MRNRKGFFLFLLLLLLFLAAQSQLPPAPSSYQPIIDQANLLSTDLENELGAQLKTHAQKTGQQIVVLTVETLGGQAISSFSGDIARKWGIGQAESDNGLLFLVAKKERKVRIEVGYGLETLLPDLQAAAIIDNQIIPSFKTGDYDKGIAAGVRALIRSTRSAPTTNSSEPPVSNWLWGSFALLGLLICSYQGRLLFTVVNEQRFRSVSLFFLMGGLLLWAALTYGLAQLQSGPWHWAIGGLVLALGFVLYELAQRRQRKAATAQWHKKMQKALATLENWTENQVLFQEKSIAEVLPSLKKRLLADPQDTALRRKALRELQQIPLHPEKYFQARSDAALRALANTLPKHWANWADPHAAAMELNLERALAQWAALAESSLSIRQEEALKADIAFFKEKQSSAFLERYAALQSSLADPITLQDLLHRFYPAEEVKKTWAAYQQRFLQPETIEDLKDLQALQAEVEVFMKGGNADLAVRNDYALRQWGENERLQELLQRPYFDAARRKALGQQLQTDLLYFQERATIALDEEETALLQAALARYQKLHDNPRAVLGYDSAYLTGEIERLMENTRWMGLYANFSPTSVQKKRWALEQLYKQAAAAKASRKPDLLFDLYSQLKGLFAQPHAYLQAPTAPAPRRLEKTSRQQHRQQRSIGALGGFSWQGRGASSFDNSSEDTDWGGGDFGGGGATGSW